MFHFRIFGRKGVATAPVPQPDAIGSQGLLDGIVAREMARPARNPGALVESIDRLDARDRADLLASLAAEAEEMREHVPYHAQVSRASLREWILDLCVSREIEPEPEHLRPLAVLLCTAHHFTSRYRSNSALKIIRLLDIATKKGGHLSPADSAMLDLYAQSRRELAEKERRRADQRKLLEVADAIEKLTGSTRSATSILLDRLEPADAPHSLAPLPDGVDFWAEVLAATAAGLHAIAADLKSRKQPAWMKTREAFDARFPAVGPVTPVFGAWNEGTDTDFAALRAAIKSKQPIAEAALYRSVRELHASVAPLSLYRWDTPAIPGVERFGDLEDADTLALLEQLVVTKDGPRAPGRWLKATLAVAGRRGPAATQASVLDWLELFHTPCPSDRSIGESWSVEVIADAAERLGEAYPDWPVQVPTDRMATFGEALAMVLASGNTLRFPGYPNLFLMGKNYGSETHALAPYSIAQRDRAGHSRYGFGQFETLTPSLENEAFTRAVVWLLPHLPDRAAAIDALERTALAGVAMKGSQGNGQRRAKPVTFAAVAGLQLIGTPEAMLALNRLLGAIEERSVTNAIRAALTRDDQPTSS